MHWITLFTALGLAAPVMGQARLDVLAPPLPAVQAGFGRALAADGGVRLVGAPEDAAGRGRVHVYRSGPHGPILDATLMGSDPDVAAFGRALALDGNRALVGAPRSAALGVDSGAVYVFERRPGGWVEVQRLVATEGGAGHLFGWSVALEGDRAVIGAPFWDAHGHDLELGAAYVFERDGAGVWQQTERLFDQVSGAPGEWFGWSVDVAGERLAVGVYHDDDGAFGAGSAWIFRRGAVGWLPEQRLRAIDPQLASYFGVALDLDGDDRLAVGAYRTHARTGSPGAAYLYERGAGGWVLSEKLAAPGLHHGSGFGGSLVLDGGRLAVGALGQERGDGALFLFRESAGLGWSLQARLDPPAADEAGLLGWSLALDGDELWVGAPEEGAAGTVTRVAWPGTPAAPCVPLANSSGLAARLYLHGSSSLGDAPFTFVADRLVPDQPCWLVAGAAGAPMPFDEGILCVAAPLTRASQILVADGSGVAGLEVLATLGLQPGASLTFQVVYRDPFGPTVGVNLSEARSAHFTP